MKPILPFKSYSVTTRLPADECCQRMAALVVPGNPNAIFVFRRDMGQGGWFQGQVTPSGFSIVRIIHYGNSFKPIAKGQFVSSADRTRIDISMRLNPYVAAFMTFWLSGVALAGVLFTWAAFMPGGPGVLGILAVALLFLFGYGIVNLPFDYEAKKMVEMLDEILESAGQDAPTGRVS